MGDKITEANSGYRQGTRAVVPEGKGARIKMRLMGWEPGATVVEGSSGDYPIAAIKRDFKESFPIGTRSRADHDGFCSPGGNIERVMAKTTSEVWFEDDGAYAWSRVKEGEATDFIRQFADVIGTSVSVGVELETEPLLDDEGEPVLNFEGRPVMVNRLSERGVPIVKRFASMLEHPYNACDFVEAPGADGAVVSVAIEAAKKVYEHTTLREAATFSLDLAGEREGKAPKDSDGAPPQKVKKESKMDPEERAALASEITESVRASVLEAIRPAAPTEDAPTLSATVEAVVAAGLTEAGRSEVYARVDRGETLESAIAAETAREAAIEAEVTRRVEAATATKADEGVFGFGFTTDDTTGSKLGTEKSDLSSDKVNEAFAALVEQEG